MYHVHNLHAIEEDKGIRLRVPNLETHAPGLPPGIDIVADKTSPRLMKTHLPARFYKTQLASGKFKVIHVTRDPRDMLVSLYNFHKPMTADCYNGSFVDFYQLFKGEKLHFGDVFDHTRGWLEAKEQFPQQILTVQYEDMHADRGSVVKKIAEFCGVELTLEETEQIVERTSFNTMKNNTRSNIHLGVNAIKDAGEGQTVRKGQMGEWKDNFTPEMNEEMKQHMKKKMGRYASYYTL